jgi:hypothetical protein
MAEPFDPYRKWLGIPPQEQPPNHYRLLGIGLFEHDPDVIENAANRQMSHIRTFQGGKNAAHSQRILSELSAAKLCLLSPDRKTKYDAELRARQSADKTVAAVPVAAVPVAALPVEAMPVGVPVGAPLPPGSLGRDERWRTDEVPEAPLAPPPVPIPMPVGTAVAPLPVVRGRSANAILARRKKNQYAVVTIVALAVLMVAGVVATVLIGPKLLDPTGVPPQEAKSSVVKPNDRPPSEPPGAANAPAAPPASAAEQHNAANDATMESAPRSAAPTDAPPSSVSPPVDASTAAKLPPIDRVRQAIFLAQEALADRDDDTFVRQITRAEQDLTGGRIGPSHRETLQQQVDELRAVSKLVQAFWQAVRENVHEKLTIGQPTKILQHELVLVAREGDVVTLRIDGEEQRATIGELDPLPAALLAGRSVQPAEPASLLPILAFLSVDRQAAVKHSGHPLVQTARRFGQDQRFHKADNADSLAELAGWLPEALGGEPESP